MASYRILSALDDIRRRRFEHEPQIEKRLPVARTSRDWSRLSRMLEKSRAARFKAASWLWFVDTKGRL